MQRFFTRPTKTLIRLCGYVDWFESITKTRLCNFDPLKPHFYIVKLEFTGVNIIFHISAQNKDCGYLLEPPRRGGSNEYPQSLFWAKKKKYQNFSSENFQFLVVKFSIYLNRRVFLMLRLVHMSEGTFSQVTAPIISSQIFALSVSNMGAAYSVYLSSFCVR